METRSGRCFSLIVSLALVGSCSAPMAAFTGTVDTQGLGVVDGVLVAQDLRGAQYVVPIGEDQRFTVSVPLGTYRLAIARVVDDGRYHIVSRVHVASARGWARYVEVAESTILNLGRVQRLDWALLRAGATITTFSAADTVVEDPGAGGGVVGEDPNLCDDGASDSVATGAIDGASQSALGGGEMKVTICHVPPGNPSNKQELTIGFPALDAHLLHHADYLGPCEPVTPPDPPACVTPESPDGGQVTPEDGGGTAATPEAP